MGAKVTSEHEGEFKDWKGAARLGKAGQLEKLSFAVSVNSVKTDNARLDRDLWSRSVQHSNKLFQEIKSIHHI